MRHQTGIYAAVLAGGTGSRMGDTERPKQFMLVDGRPVLMYSVMTFAEEDVFDAVLVLCPQEWMEHAENLIKTYLPDVGERVVVLPGGETRNETIMRAIDYIDARGRLDEDTILLTHDAARPFVNSRIIRDNIDAVRETGACDTVIPATDTIVTSEDGKTISGIPERRRMYASQTPQTFRAMKLRSLYESLTEEERDTLTDACRIYVMKGEPVSIAEGGTDNIKITYRQDLAVAEALLHARVRE